MKFVHVNQGKCRGMFRESLSNPPISSTLENWRRVRHLNSFGSCLEAQINALLLRGHWSEVLQWFKLSSFVEDPMPCFEDHCIHTIF